MIKNKVCERLCIVHICEGAVWAGVETQLYYFSVELARNENAEFSVILLNHGILEQRLIGLGIPVVVFDEQKLSSLQIFLSVFRYLKHRQPHIVHTHRQKDSIIGTIAAVLATRAKCFRTVHGKFEPWLRFWQPHKHLLRMLDLLCARALQTGIILVSNDLHKVLKATYPATKLTIIENGIDTGIINSTSSTSTAVELPGADKSIKIAFVGRLVPVKRPDVFVEAAKCIRDIHGDQFSFYIIGEGPLANELSAKIENLKLNSCLYMLGFKENVPAYLLKMNMLFITSDHEGLPMNLLEALCLKVPVVAHAVGDIPSVLDQGKCGTLIPNQNSENYVKAVQIYLDDSEAMHRKSEQGLLRVCDIYSTYRCVQKHLQLYKKSISIK